jgi:hypothetical protein
MKEKTAIKKTPEKMAATAKPATAMKTIEQA